MLAARSSFFHTLFDRPFRESKSIVVQLPERAEIVEAALRHAYTGLVPDVDVLEVMALAHRLGMEDCVVDCAALLCLIPREHIVRVLPGLHPLREHPAVDAAWAALMQRLCEESDLAESVVEALLNRGQSKQPTYVQSRKSVATQTCMEGEVLVGQEADGELNYVQQLD